jgi:hypothetical protein
VAPTGADIELPLKHNSKMPEQATHLLVFSKNAYGEYGAPGQAIVKDAYNPREKPKGIEFVDEDGDKGEVSGTVTVLRAAEEATIDEYALHWGRSPTKKISSSSFLRDIPKETSHDGTSTWYVSRNTKIPDGATHLILFSKNEHGEHPSPAALKVADNTKPCLNRGDDDCPAGVSVTGATPQAFTVSRAKNEANVTDYVLYFGRQSCIDGDGQSGAKNGHIKDLPASGEVSFEMNADTAVPDGTTHVLVFSKNAFGESDFCVSTELPPKEPKTEL